jgi:hypothetical protein
LSVLRREADVANLDRDVAYYCTDHALMQQGGRTEPVVGRAFVRPDAFDSLATGSYRKRWEFWVLAPEAQLRIIAGTTELSSA